MSYGLTNRVLVRKDTEGEPQSGAPRELLNVSVRQSYYTRRERQQVTTPSYSYGFNNARAECVFADLAPGARDADDAAGDRLSARIRPAARCRAGPKLLGMGLNGMFRTPAVNVTGGWSRQAFALTTSDRRRHQRQQHRPGDRRFPASSKASSAAWCQFQYDVTKSTLLNQRYVGFLQRAVLRRLVRIPGLQLSQLPNQFLLPQDRRFNMSFTLAGVGSFSNFFGAFGGGTF